MIYHSGKLEEIFESGIYERLESNGINRTNLETPPIQTIFLRNNRDLCTVSFDASGEFLYKRGNGKNVTKATLRETTAALILLASGIHGYEQVLDPMCGSGTFSLEAVSILTNTPPAPGREFPFMNWPFFKESTFRFIKDSAMKKVIPSEMVKQKIFTTDIDPKVVRIARSNIPETFSRVIGPEVSDFFSLSSGIVKNKKTLIVLNPPYGKRIEEAGGKSIYSEIGKKIRKDFSICGYAIIVPGHEKENDLKLDFSRKIFFMNGGIKTAVLFRDV
jgi:putative N6-adenine-specific DNA methylase